MSNRDWNYRPPENKTQNLILEILGVVGFTIAGIVFMSIIYLIAR